ncbi:hypothetical protein ILUMI_05587, partial [Ignelater luminosus]
MVKQFRKWFAVIIFLFVIMFCILLIKNPTADSKNYSTIINKEQYIAMKASDYESNLNGKWRGFSNEQINKLSKLGEILYLDRNPPEVDPSKNYTILIWKHGPALERRHIKHYTEE